MTPHVEQHEVGLFERHPIIIHVLVGATGFLIGLEVNNLVFNHALASVPDNMRKFTAAGMQLAYPTLAVGLEITRRTIEIISPERHKMLRTIMQYTE